VGGVGAGGDEEAVGVADLNPGLVAAAVVEELGEAAVLDEGGEVVGALLEGGVEVGAEGAFLEEGDDEGAGDERDRDDDRGAGGAADADGLGPGDEVGELIDSDAPQAGRRR
jgi:hypothetical protein